ncbi:hypothetical protein [Parachlamydia acanthamoebae]|uniref:hypothetical protein n=1 Tax=Parachlamydia acanthamoebae TaxID=83552 RepID=UPI000750FFD6|nr:hypothetical protein [Parachlamydia acanthamoebae]
MSQKQRLRSLKSKTHAQLLAFFFLPRRFDNRKEIELQLWNDYVRNGGNKTATPAFLPTISETYGFVCCVEVSFVKEWFAKNSTPPH